MDKPVFTHEPVVTETHAVLTPRLFVELDRYTRLCAGYALCVIPEEEGEPFAYVSPWALGLADRVDGEWRVTKESACIIYLANKVNLEAFYAQKRPELDWTAIQPREVYRFIVFHEVAHALYRDAISIFNMQLEQPRLRSKPWWKFVKGAIELRADRWAWEMLRPGQPMPTAPALSATPEQYEQALHSMPNQIQKPREPLPTDQRKAVPMPHVKEGIPWADEAGAPLFWRQALVEV